MTDLLKITGIDRRRFLKTGGALIIGLSLGARTRAQEVDAVEYVPGPGQPDLNQLDTWIAIHSDNTATIYFGFVELGQGNSTALLQIAAEELDMEMHQVRTVRRDTNRTPNQGGTVASASISRGGPRIRAAAAEARQTLLGLASAKLKVPPDQLTVSRGVVSVKGHVKQSSSYGQLIGDKQFSVKFTGTAPVKNPKDYRIVGSRVPRLDIPDKASGKFEFVHHARLPRMLHGRVVRPRGQGAYGAAAKVLSVDESSIRQIPGARLLRKQNFLGVVAPNEWDAVRAAQQLKVHWDMNPTLGGSDNLAAQMRSEKTTDEVIVRKGDIESGFKSAEHIVSRSRFGPYQSHATFAPNCAVADVSSDSANILCSTQNIYETRANIAGILGMEATKVRVQFYEGAGTYGHSCYEDVAQSAAILSQLAGRPVRLQFMRWDEHGWDNYAPAHLADVRIGCDSQGKLLAYEYKGSQHQWNGAETAQQLALGTEATELDGPVAMKLSPLNVGSMYDVPNMYVLNRRIRGIEAYPKGSYMRSPLDISIAFASEQAIDELAYLSGMDSYEFRRKNISDPRWLGVLDAVAKASSWTPRRATENISKTKVVKGRGIAVGTHLSSYAAAVAEIEVDTESGAIVAKHMYGALDAGLTINPAFVENQITGMLVQATSRMLKEEVKFSSANVTSLDWNSYPVLRFSETPAVTAIVIQQLTEKSSGGGEEVLCSAAAAIANALFDATGVRLDQYPLTPERVINAFRPR